MTAEKMKPFLKRGASEEEREVSSALRDALGGGFTDGRVGEEADESSGCLSDSIHDDETAKVGA